MPSILIDSVYGKTVVIEIYDGQNFYYTDMRIDILAELLGVPVDSIKKDTRFFITCNAEVKEIKE
jgi:hypothetical protein